MKSVGEAMAIGRTFKEALQKAAQIARNRTLWPRRGRKGFAACSRRTDRQTFPLSSKSSRIPGHERVFFIRYALQARSAPSSKSTSFPPIDPWFLENIRQTVEEESRIAKDGLWQAQASKKLGFSDRQIAILTAQH